MIKLLSLQANNFKQLQDVNLRFPDCGSVLIEGRNEAGKSTLFEAIFFALFGKPLLSGTTVEDLLGYEATEGIVLLDISTPGGRFLIQRKIRRAKTRATAEARLRVYNADGSEGEEVRGASGVNERLQQELKLDADAFLNSCFVEQKKLEKLEGMTAADREKSLMRLLNMDRMLDDERNFKITIEDSRRLQRLEQRVRLAEVMAEIPGVQKRGRECKVTLDIIAMKDRLADIDGCRAAIANAAARLAALEGPIKELEGRVKRLEAIRAACAGAEIIGVRLGAVERQANDAARLRGQISELDRLETEAIPALSERQAQMRRLRSRWSRLIALDTEAGRAETEADDLKRRIADAGAAQQAVAELEARIDAETKQVLALEAEESKLSVAERASALRQALEDWHAAAAARDGVDTISRQAAEAGKLAESAQQYVADATAATRKASRNVAVTNGVWTAAGIAALFCVSIPALSIVLALFALIGLFAAIRAFQVRQQCIRNQAAGEAKALDGQNTLVRLEGQMENAQATSGAAAGRMEQAVIRLEAVGEPIPASRDDAMARLSGLPETNDLGDSGRLADVRRELAQMQGAIEEQRRAITARHADIDAANVAVLMASAQRLESWSARVRQTVVSHWAGIARDRADTLGIDSPESMPANREAVSAAEAAVSEQIRQMQRNVAERPAIEQRLAELAAAADRERAEMAAAWPAIAAVRTDASLPDSVEAARSLRMDLAGELDALDEDGTTAELRKRREDRNAAENDRTVASREVRTAEADLRRRADALKYPSDDPLTQEALAEAIPGWDTADPAQRDELEVEFEELKERDAGLKARRADLATALGIDPATERLDPDVERAQRDDVARDQAVREKAITILRNARERIMGKVLPYTIEHMRRILPALTMERYHDAKLTSDYKIEVWDERAGMWKSKNIFSGGTRDQFSLALRLAFAVATLPQERGAAPGFIFLDEPLSSFDVERSAALMYLLTKGEIAETFDQILVISHSQAIAADEFQYRIRLNAGRIEDAPEDMRPAPTQLALDAIGE